MKQQSCYETNTLRLSKIRVYPSPLTSCANTPASPRLNLAYTYQNNGNISQTVDATQSETLNYTYDELDRLDTVSGAYPQNYDYNPIGNITSKDTSANPGTANLVSWWRMNETSGTRNDSYGTNYCGASNSTKLPDLPKKPKREKDNEPGGPPLISYSEEDGLCIKVYCSGGESYSRFWHEHVLPLRLKDLKWLSDLFGFGTDTYDNWTGTRTSPKIGFGLDVATQLLADASRDDLTLDQRLARAGVNGVEGMSISAISASVATTASEAALAPSMTLAVRTKQVWIPPVAVAATWATMYIVTNIALSYVADRANSNIPYLGP